MNRKTLMDIAKECGAFTDALYAGRHSNVVFTPRELDLFAEKLSNNEANEILKEELRQAYSEIDRLKDLILKADEERRR